MSNPTRTSSRLGVSSHGWKTEPQRPAMANDVDHRVGLQLTDQGLIRDGRPWIPVSGELHYSRVPRARWAERLQQLRSGGISVLACYVPWLHHVAERGRPSFDGNLDVGAIVDLAREIGLEVVLRIGPWAHGELRNGGYPDWVQELPVQHRTNDPAYLELVREWWGQLAGALAGRANPETILGIQLENELYDQPEHIVELKKIARECGLSAPFWTATAWGGAQLPLPEVFPLYGGYGDGFWVDADAPWDPSFRDHFFFSHVWDDPGIGADQRDSIAELTTDASPSIFPPATCELGGGMATAYHRRPLPTARDVATVAHCKIGNGSAWQGYYMYVGGTNPPGGLQESHATGYPNDMTELSYDFHAPVGEAGRLGESHALLRTQHAFLGAFDDQIGAMPSHLPDQMPSGVEDRQTLRWAFRGDDRGGVVFVAWHQSLDQLDDYEGAQFTIRFPDGDVTLPSAPVDIPAGTIAHWPVRLPVGGVEIEWLTASILTVLPGDVPTLVAIAEQGVRSELALLGPDGPVLTEIQPSLEPVRVTSANGSALDILVLPARYATETWVFDGDSDPTLLLSSDELRYADGKLTALSRQHGPLVLLYSTAERQFHQVDLVRRSEPAAAANLEVTAVRPAGAIPADYGWFDGRPSAPTSSTVEELGAVFTLPPLAEFLGDDTCLEIDWAGDVGHLRVDGNIVADRFWDGSRWRINLRDVGVTASSIVEIVVLPMSPNSPVHIPAEAATRRSAATAPIALVDAARVERRATWENDVDLRTEPS